MSGVLAAAADVRFVGLDGDGPSATLVHFEVPTFGSVARELFEQPLLWDHGPQPHETAFDLFGAALRDVDAGRKDSDRYDPALLRRLRRYDRLLERGVRQIEMPNTPVEQRGRIDEGVLRAACELVSTTPASRRVRVTGRIEVMAVTPRVFKLEIQPGELLSARWEGDQPIEQLRGLLNTAVVVEGMGVFRPSGSLLRVDADAITPATSADDFFRHIPVAECVRDYTRQARLKGGEMLPYPRLRGVFRGDESDEDFETVLRSLR